MKKREFIKHGTILTVGALTVPMSSCKNEQGSPKAAGTENGTGSVEFTPFELPELGFEKAALEPYIDARTMEIHHDRHHAGYVKKLNAALDGHRLAGKSLEDIVSGVNDSDTAVRNNGGGHYNHSLFWQVMTPGGSNSPEGQLADAINSAFGSFDTFKEKFSKAAATRFGSGWAWLSLDGDKKLFVSSTPNQDNPLMASLVEKSGQPILGIDVWEHAYYLQYQNRRTEYIDNFFNIINWETVAKNYAGLI